MDQQGMVRVAMIGAGRMANSVHYPSLASFDDVEFASVCDLDEELLAATADRYGIERRYTDYRRMVEESAPDGVYAIGQPNIMFDIWVWCLQQGLNLYIEKPMGLSRHQAIGSGERFVYGGHRAKNREFIDSIKSGRDVTTSPFRDCLKTMDAAERILARATPGRRVTSGRLQSSASFDRLTDHA